MTKTSLSTGTNALRTGTNALRPVTAVRAGDLAELTEKISGRKAKKPAAKKPAKRATRKRAPR